MLQGRPHDHYEYVIYDKRRALIEYVIFYSTPSVHSSMNAKTAHRVPFDVMELDEWYIYIFIYNQDGSTVDIRRLNKIYNLTKKQRMKQSSLNAHAMRYTNRLA